MADTLKYILSRPSRTEHLRIGLPSSKSIANRLLVMQHLSGGSVRLMSGADCDDIRLMKELLESLSGRPSAEPLTLDCDNAGTVFRFLTAVLSVSPGRYLLTGSPRMCERPVFPLVDALRSLGADIRYAGKAAYPPLLIRGRTLTGGRVSLPGNLSSQFISALLMIAPALSPGLEISIDGQRVSEPYIEMTLTLMRQAGVSITKLEDGYLIPGQPYGSLSIPAEADWSAASYWYELASLTGEEIFLEGLSARSLQGDAALAAYYRHLGLESLFEEGGVRIRPGLPPGRQADIDLSGQPDLAPALACSMAGLGMKGRLTGLHHLRIKESDRLASLTEGLNLMGFDVRNDGGSLIFSGNQTIPDREITVSSYGDHRMAMAFAMLAVKTGGLTIADPLVTGKSYPGFWEELQRAGFRIR